MRALPTSFVETTPHGTLVAVHIDVFDPFDDDDLHDDERAIAAPWAAPRRRTFAGGRVALRRALRAIGVDASGPIARDDRGAPILPAGARGSITHKDDVAMALVDADGPERLGVDVEALDGRALGVARHVFTDAESAELAALPDDQARMRSAAIRFSAKEALYKALDPFVRRYVGFREVEARPGDDVVAMTLDLREGPFIVDARYVVRDGVVITTARVRPP